MLPKISSPNHNLGFLKGEGFFKIADQPLREDIINHLHPRGIVRLCRNPEITLSKGRIKRHNFAKIPWIQPIQEMNIIERRVWAGPVDNFFIGLKIPPITLHRHFDA